MLHDTRRAAAVLAIVAIALVPACTKDKKALAVPEPSLTVSSVATPTPTPVPTKAPPKPKPKTHPFTGRADKRLPVAVIKIDNTGPAMPQSGLDRADLIYQELVEGGITRLAAVFSSRTPTLVGPVRSARETDIELLGQFGRVTLGYSGAQKGVLRLVFAADLVNGRYDEALPAYHLSSGRHMPYNTYVSVPRLLSLKRGARARDIGLRFGKLTARSRPARKATVYWSPATTNTVRYDKASGRWQVSIRGRNQVKVDNVIVQYVDVRASRFHDFTGANTPFTDTTGSGRATLFRDGRRVGLTWSRKAKRDATTWRDAKGVRMTLHKGSTYIMLVPRGTRVSVT